MDYYTEYPDILPKKHTGKHWYLRVMLFFVGRAFQSLWKLDKNIQQEFNMLPEKFSFAITVLPDGPGVFLQKDAQGKLRYKGKLNDEADVMIRFRNIASAMRVFTFQISSYKAYAQNGISVSGDLAATMGIMRCLNLVEDYLLPGFITKKILKRKPKTPWLSKLLKRFILYISIIFGM